MPELMEKLANPLMDVQYGQINADMAIYHIKNDILIGQSCDKME